MHRKLVLREIALLAKRGWWLILATITLPIVSDAVANYLTTYLNFDNAALFLVYGLVLLLIVALFYVAAEAILESKTQNILSRFSYHLEQIEGSGWHERNNLAVFVRGHLRQAVSAGFSENSQELGHIRRAGIRYRLHVVIPGAALSSVSLEDWRTEAFVGSELEGQLKEREDSQCAKVSRRRRCNSVPAETLCPFDSLFIPLKDIDGFEGVLFFHKERGGRGNAQFRHQSILEGVSNRIEQTLRDVKQLEQLSLRLARYEQKLESLGALPDGAMTYPAFLDHLTEKLTGQGDAPPEFFLAAVTLVMPFSNSQILEMNRLLVHAMQEGPAFGYGPQIDATLAKAAKDPRQNAATVGSYNNVKLVLVPGAQEFAKAYIRFLKDKISGRPIKVGDWETQVDIAAGIVSCSQEDLNRTIKANQLDTIVKQALDALEAAEQIGDELKMQSTSFLDHGPTFSEYGEILP